jgi:hypothetical protein
MLMMLMKPSKAETALKRFVLICFNVCLIKWFAYVLAKDTWKC